MSAVICVKSTVRGYHIFRDEWDPSIDDIFELKTEETNCHDTCRYAVVVISDEIVGHVPQEISKNLI